MAPAKKGDTVKIHYTGTLDDGSVFDSSLEREPLQFKLGSGQVIAGFDKMVTGLNVGDKKTEKLPPEMAYGVWNKEMAIEMPRDRFPSDMVPEVGMQMSLRNDQNQSFEVVVMEINDEKAILDANPPLAGKSLTFEIELIEIS
jgi:peptidylprolyl isomerase